MYIRKLAYGGIIGTLTLLGSKLYHNFQPKYIHDPKQLSEKDFRNKSLMCYLMSGDNNIDSKIQSIMKDFVQKYQNLISQNFEVVFFHPKEQNNQRIQLEQPQLVIFKSEDLQAIPLRKYIRKGIYDGLFKRMVRYINQFQEVKTQNIHKITSSLEDRNSCLLVAFPENNQPQAIKKAKNMLKDFISKNQIIEKQAEIMLVSDQHSKTILGLNSNIFKAQPNQPYIIAPYNQNVKQIDPSNLFSIHGKYYTIIKANQQAHLKFIFHPIIPKNSKKILLRATIDLNLDNEEYKHLLYKQFSKIDGVDRILTYGETQQGKPYSIQLENSNFDQLVNAYQPNNQYSNDYKLKLLSSSHRWNYQGEIESNKINQWIKFVTDKPQLQHYKTQYVARNQYNSLKIVGQQYINILKQPGDKLIFHYSKSCFSCKRFGGIYQEIANQYKNKIKFYRIDNDINKIQGIRNFNSTPVFLMYKNSYPIIPFIYKNNYFTKKLFQDFIQITSKVSVIDSKIVDQLIKERQLSEGLLKDII